MLNSRRIVESLAGIVLVSLIGVATCAEAQHRGFDKSDGELEKADVIHTLQLEHINDHLEEIRKDVKSLLSRQ